MSTKRRVWRGIGRGALALSITMHVSACCTPSVGPRVSDTLAIKRFAADEQPLARECVDSINAQRNQTLSSEAHQQSRSQWSALIFTGLAAGATGLSVAAGDDPGWDGKETILASTLVLTLATGIYALATLGGGADTTSYTFRQSQLKVALSKPSDAEKTQRIVALSSCITGQ